jgi:5'-deoxynucleotidase YfbR-like HD superfamily hydrolase
VKDRLDEFPPKGPDESRSHLLLIARTVYISLVSLGEEEASREYIQRLFESPEWDELNRAFHLEYYGDVPYLPKQRLTHRDSLEKFPNTFRSLFGRLSIEYDSAAYTAREIDLYTLLSLAQHRHVRGTLDPEQREQLRELVLRVLRGSDIKSGTLRRFLEMQKRNLEYPRFNVGQIAETLYGLKSARRSGWIDHGLRTSVESVADHTYGAYLLGMLYLPEQAPKWEGYNKGSVLEMILIHDLGEAITGDLLPRDRNEQKASEERETYEYIGTMGTYPRVGRLERVKELWQEFDQKASINARIANDLDKLENLFQLCLYRKRNKPVRHAAQWQQDLIEEIETAAGRNLFDIIKEQFKDFFERPGMR